MRRREFLGAFGSAAVWPLAARAQQALPVIGFLNSASLAEYAQNVAAFMQGLRETGYIEGQNVKIEYRFAEGQYERLPALMADLVQRRVTVIAAMSTPAALAAKTANTTIPIAFQMGGDPVKLGLVTSLNRPIGNLTGVSNLNEEVGPKRLELLYELLPAAKLFALLVNPTNPIAETLSRDMQEPARILGLQLRVLHASTERDFDTVFASLVQQRIDGLVITSSDPFFSSHGQQLGALSLRYAVPTVYQFRAFAAAGGLVSYGSGLRDAYHTAGVYTGRLLKGEKPADLPVQQSTKIELIINLKTAKTLGINVPNALIGRADEVIE